jgi:hypothetical protein
MNKTYPVYNFDFFDESIEENNSAFVVLSKKSKEKSELESENGYAYWFSGESDLELKKILKYVWSKEDVDNFVDEHPECETETFNIDDYIKYCPLQEKRNNLINQIFEK